MIAEHYNQVVRALDDGQTVRLRVDVDSRFTTDDDRDGYNTIAEIPGAGSKAREVVMLGAHMDSWHTGTGAADNGAGVAVMMEEASAPSSTRNLRTCSASSRRSMYFLMRSARSSSRSAGTENSCRPSSVASSWRSEEHTSELQSLMRI